MIKSQDFSLKMNLIQRSYGSKSKKTVREIKSQDACLIEGSAGVLNLVCSDIALNGDSVSTLYEKRWKVEEFYKSLKHNVDLATSPTKTIRTQSNHIFLSILAFFKLEVLKIKHKINHFALRAKLLIKANQMAYRELLLLRGV